MSIKIENFGKLNGEDIKELILTNKSGMCVHILTYGATLHNIIFDGKDVILGYDTLDDYVNVNTTYQGATIGRYANRISEGMFILNGKEYNVGKNETGRGHLHGGIHGFDKQIWEIAEMEDTDAPSVTLKYLSKDGEEGYPGNLKVFVKFEVTAQNSLKISYRAVSDKDTVINLTNHAYYNINGFNGGNVLDTELYVNADFITEVDNLLMPTGKMIDVTGTPFDFRMTKTIGEDIDKDDPQIKLGGGYDHNFVLNGGKEFKLAVCAYSKKSGIKLSCYTDQPGLQIYTSNFLDEKAGKSGINLYKNQGFCLETQHFPDSPNNADFPTTILRAEEVFNSVTEYKFEKIL